MISSQPSPPTLFKIDKCEEYIPIIARSLSDLSQSYISSPTKKLKKNSRESVKEAKIKQKKINYLEIMLQDVSNLIHTSRSNIIDEINILKNPPQPKKFIFRKKTQPSQPNPPVEPGIITNILIHRGYGFIRPSHPPQHTKDLIFYTQNSANTLAIGDSVQFTRIKTNKKSDLAKKIHRIN